MNWRAEKWGKRRLERGQSAIEFALTIVILVVLLVGMLELTMFVYTYSVLADAAKEGVRYAIVHGANGTPSAGPTGVPQTSSSWTACSSSDSGTDSVVTAVQRYAALSLHSTSAINVFVCYPDKSNSPGSAVEVSVNYLYQPLFGLGWPKVNVAANSAGRIMF
ncbi:MAG TPA: TadE family protein [Terriglobales bacterium]|jgi:Flp pilus assembly protein TadG|nr:TadE family protein [Terriglobales bacterium]